MNEETKTTHKQLRMAAFNRTTSFHKEPPYVESFRKLKIDFDDNYQNIQKFVQQRLKTAKGRKTVADVVTKYFSSSYVVVHQHKGTFAVIERGNRNKKNQPKILMTVHFEKKSDKWEVFQNKDIEEEMNENDPNINIPSHVIDSDLIKEVFNHEKKYLPGCERLLEWLNYVNRYSHNFGKKKLQQLLQKFSKLHVAEYFNDTYFSKLGDVVTEKADGVYIIQHPIQDRRSGIYIEFTLSDDTGRWKASFHFINQLKSAASNNQKSRPKLQAKRYLMIPHQQQQEEQKEEGEYKIVLPEDDDDDNLYKQFYMNGIAPEEYHAFELLRQDLAHNGHNYNKTNEGITKHINITDIGTANLDTIVSWHCLHFRKSGAQIVFQIDAGETTRTITFHDVLKGEGGEGEEEDPEFAAFLNAYKPPPPSSATHDDDHTDDGTTDDDKSHDEGSTTDDASHDDGSTTGGSTASTTDEASYDEGSTTGGSTASADSAARAHFPRFRRINKRDDHWGWWDERGGRRNKHRRRRNKHGGRRQRYWQR